MSAALRVFAVARSAPRGGSPREGARSEERAEQRLAAGGRRLPVSIATGYGSPGLLVTLVSRHFRFAAERASVTVEESHDDRVAWGRV
jgi:hypothetical protein